jgi:hypothetical protein
VLKNTNKSWLEIIILLLIGEKIIQHIVVTLGFYVDWAGIRSTVAVNPDVLMVLGGIVAVLFIVSLWGMLTGQPWVISLLIGLALFDMIGEFVAQGLFTIVITVSFLVATALLVLVLIYRRQRSKQE